MKRSIHRRIALLLIIGPILVGLLLQLIGFSVGTFRLGGGFPPASAEFSLELTGLFLVGLCLLGVLWLLVALVLGVKSRKTAVRVTRSE